MSAAPIVRITAKLERELRKSLELSWGRYKSTQAMALANTTSNGFTVEDLWREHYNARAEYVKILKQFTTLTTDRRIPPEYESRVAEELEREARKRPMRQSVLADGVRVS